MAPLFTPNHVKLVSACYPPSSALLTSPANSQELSRLAYYAANRPSKINKVGNELEKRVKMEAKKAQAGNLRSRASVLISLSIFQAVAIECRRDIALLSPSLLASGNTVLTALPTDLEVAAAVATVFCAWTTYTDGHVIGVDQKATADYKAALRHFADLSKIDAQNGDTEARNRTRLVGLAALTEVVNSEALYNTSNEFQDQVAVILAPLMVIILQTDVATLTEQATHVKDAAISSMGDFRARPTMERRAASIHIHVDGTSGPSNMDVVTACLRTISSLLEHSNGWQLGHAMHSAFLGLAKLNGWKEREQCIWLARMTCEWTQYQHRYVVPTRLVERLAGVHSAPAPAGDVAAATDTLLAMVTAVLTTPAPLVNLSTSDIMHNLIGLVVGRAAETGVPDDDQRLKSIAACIAALGTHVYYSEQIQDLANELISRLVVIETQGLLNAPGTKPRSLAIRTLLAGLLGLMKAAVSPAGPRDTRDAKILKRSRISPDTWNDTLSLLCDPDYAVRAEYARVLAFYLSTEMNAPPGSEVAPPSAAKTEATVRVINTMHAYLFVLATAPSLTIIYNPNIARSESLLSPNTKYTNGLVSETPEEGSISDRLTQTSKATTQRDRASRRSMSIPANRKSSILQAAIEKFPSRLTSSTEATASDYAHILMVMEALIVALPIQGALVGVPMLLALDSAADAGENVSQQRRSTVKELVTRIWLLIGRQWQCTDLTSVATTALEQIPGGSRMPRRPSITPGMPLPPQPIPIASDTNGSYSARGATVEAEKALVALARNMHLQQSTGMDESALQQHLSTKWTADSALKGAMAQPSAGLLRKNDPHTPIYKISKITEGLSNHENASIHSLAKSGKEVGVNELRDALEGRSPYTNGTNGKAPSVTTFDHNTGASSDGRTLTKRKSLSRKRPVSTVEVRDFLNNLGIPAPKTQTTLNGGAPPVILHST